MWHAYDGQSERFDCDRRTVLVLMNVNINSKPLGLCQLGFSRISRPPICTRVSRLVSPL